MLGIITALPLEARTIAKHYHKPTEILALTDRNILLCAGGIGPERARTAAENLIAQGATALISWGVAAGLKPTLKAGDLVLAQSIIHPSASSIAVDSTWQAAIFACLKAHMPFECGNLAHATEVLATPASKQALFQQTQAHIADMESYAIGTVALKAKLPFLAVRVVVDPADTCIPELLHTQASLTAMDEFGRIQTLKLTKHILLQPSLLFELIKLGQYSKQACKTLRKIIKLIETTNLLPAR